VSTRLGLAVWLPVQFRHDPPPVAGPAEDLDEVRVCVRPPGAPAAGPLPAEL